MSEIYLANQMKQHLSFAPMVAKAPETGAPRYLAFLHLSRGTQESFRVIETIVNNSPRIDDEITALLVADGWRSHLVGGISLLFCKNPASLAAPLWSALDKGSWVSPQLAVIAYWVDKDFPQNAKARIESGCPIRGKHIITEMPQSFFEERAAKACLSLITLCKGIPSCTGWVEKILSSIEFKEWLEKDFDHGDKIAEGWLARLEQEMRKYGKELKESFA